MEISDAVFAAANQRGAATKAAFPAAVAIHYDRRISRIVISLASGLELAFDPHLTQELAHARPADLVDPQISPSGLGIHFPKLDADLYLPALLEGFLGTKRWLAAVSGRQGGKVSTQAKAAAARSNGRLGGRPKKVAQTAGYQAMAADTAREAEATQWCNALAGDLLNEAR